MPLRLLVIFGFPWKPEPRRDRTLVSPGTAVPLMATTTVGFPLGTVVVVAGAVVVVVAGVVVVVVAGAVVVVVGGVVVVVVAMVLGG